jgi:hypothetical protein
MHVVALRHWLMDLAHGPAMHAIAIQNIFSTFDPAQKL